MTCCAASKHFYQCSELSFYQNKNLKYLCSFTIFCLIFTWTHFSSALHSLYTYPKDLRSTKMETRPSTQAIPV